jgi:acetyl esterase
VSIVGRTYLDRGDRLSGRINPPALVTVVCGWGPGGGPRNVTIQRADGTKAVVPFPRRLRKPPAIGEVS